MESAIANVLSTIKYMKGHRRGSLLKHGLLIGSNDSY